MLKKLLLTSLFAMVTLGFFVGFVSYQKEIREALSQSINTPSLEEEPPLVEKPSLKKTIVPRIIGLTEEEAKKLLEEAGLLSSAVTEHTDQVEKGHVFYQRPMEGTEMFEGQEVIYTVSAGPFGQADSEEEEEDKEILMPSLLGKTQREGENILRELGLRVRVRKEYSADVAAGIVMEQEPSINAKLQPSDEVTLWVSLGAKPEEIKHQVPRVVGKTRAEAERLLKNAGYEVSVTEKEDADVNIGKVISQSPGGGTEVSVKGRVQITIGKKKTAAPETPSEGPGEEEPDPGDAKDPTVETPVEPPSVETPVEPPSVGEPEEPVETGNE
ncbi:PASTA domain-containing protein [Proteiniclasticum ruminis]|uniref:PASTA domain-containing protein n=1 Tax=Proteiniclasticum ruminis TaxID=398199 RepID=UPI00289EC6B0|nr:PASTA domain-containing protein [Proteiniclasticum ruminis]